ncbi:MAG: Fur family transcriptional regulator [Phycisphaerales bacterium JB061]|jgi:Fur family ferric uptake transcriptional regulator
MDLDPIPDLDEGQEVPAIFEPLCAVFRRRLKAEGQKYTPERARVLDAVIRMDGPFEAEALVEDLRQSGYRVSKATVYRTIKLMQDAGIVQRVLGGDDVPRFQLIYGTRPDDTITRVDTDEVISVDIPELIAIRDRICAELGLTATSHRFQIFATGNGKKD